MDHLTIFWPQDGDPLLIYEGEHEEDDTWSKEGEKESCCEHPPVHGQLLAGIRQAPELALDAVRLLADKLEVADLAHVGAPEGPLAYAARASASLYRLSNGWLVARTERSDPRLHAAPHSSFLTCGDYEGNPSAAAFLLAPDRWPERANK